MAEKLYEGNSREKKNEGIDRVAEIGPDSSVDCKLLLPLFGGPGHHQSISVGLWDKKDVSLFLAKNSKTLK